MSTRLQDAAAERVAGGDPVPDLAALVTRIRSAAMAATAMHLASSSAGLRSAPASADQAAACSAPSANPSESDDTTRPHDSPKDRRPAADDLWQAFGAGVADTGAPAHDSSQLRASATSADAFPPEGGRP